MSFRRTAELVGFFWLVACCGLSCSGGGSLHLDSSRLERTVFPTNSLPLPPPPADSRRPTERRVVRVKETTGPVTDVIIVVGTMLVDEDRDGKGDWLAVKVCPQGPDGKIVPRSGRLVLVLSPDGGRETGEIRRWVVPAAELRHHWNPAGYLPGFLLKLGWTGAPPEGESFTLTATFRPPGGKEVEERIDVFLQK